MFVALRGAARGRQQATWRAVRGQALQATEGEVEELRGHVIICGFGRVGQTIGQLLAERLIPFVAVDVRVDRVQVRAPSNHLAGHQAFWLARLSISGYWRCLPDACLPAMLAQGAPA